MNTSNFRSIRQFGAIRSSKPKYSRGAAACNHCQLGRHKDCRPKLDNTLCTCNCPAAESYRLRLARMREENPTMPVETCIIEIAPKMRGVCLGDEWVSKVDRTKQCAYDYEQNNLHRLHRKSWHLPLAGVK